MPETVSIEPWLRHLQRYVPIARKGLDPEGVHQMRVAIERLRVSSSLARHPGLGDDLRWLRHRLAAVRDLDAPVASGRVRKKLPKLARDVRVRVKASRRDEYDLDSLHAVRRAVRRHAEADKDGRYRTSLE